MYQAKKQGQIAVGVIITISVILIIGVVMLQVIFSQISTQQSQTSVQNDLYSAEANTTCTRLTTECYAKGTLAVVNVSKTLVVNGNFTECTINGDFQGVRMIEDIWEGNSLNASYTRISCAFIQGNLTRIILNNVPVLFAVLLMVFLAGFIILKK